MSEKLLGALGRQERTLLAISSASFTLGCKQTTWHRSIEAAPVLKHCPGAQIWWCSCSTEDMRAGVRRAVHVQATSCRLCVKMQAVPSIGAGHTSAALHSLQSTLGGGGQMAATLTQLQTATAQGIQQESQGALARWSSLNMEVGSTLQELGAQAGTAVAQASAAIGNALAPLHLFEGSWTLDVLLVTTVGLLAYSLLIAAPRQ